MSIYLQYLNKLITHKWFVFVAGLRVGKIPLWRLVFHDMSKFTWLEFTSYARHFYGQPDDNTEWLQGLNHHLKHNKHHWDYWVLYGNPLPMPESYIREMVADWMGAGRAYNGDWDMTNWLKANLSRINIHDKTREYLYDVLRERGYHVEGLLSTT